jgi:hypothetical protein
MLQIKLLSVEGKVSTILQAACFKTESFESSWVCQRTVPIFFELAECNVVVRPLRAGNAGMNRGKIQLEDA